MRRRDLLKGGMAIAQLLASRRVLAQGGSPMTRAAVVIGVNKTGDLPVLKAAVSSAQMMAGWLKGEGFETKLIVDDKKPVVAADIKKAVTEFVRRGTLEQLLVYFSGHGIGVAFNEYWLLTGAPSDLDEAVSFVECVELARTTAIPSIVLISDACRSIPGFNASRIRGSIVFPNGTISPGAVQPEVDRFFATLPGAPAYEVKEAANNHKGIYTSTFLDAFVRPPIEMVRTVSGVQVVPNRSLKTYLLRQVPKRLAAASIQLNQTPDSRIESGEQTYIGRAVSPELSLGAIPPTVPSTIFDVVDTRLDRAGVGRLVASRTNLSDERLKALGQATGFDAAEEKIARAKAPPSFETETGFAINGAQVKAALSGVGASAHILNTGDGFERPGLVRIQPSPPVERSASTVVLVFDDGSGTVLAALTGFIGTVVVERGRVVSVSYRPSEHGSRWHDYLNSRARLDELRSLVATAARFGVFRIEGDSESRNSRAAQLADQIRMLKGIDPTLGLYAAYGYAEANLTEQVRSVRDYMLGDLNRDLFDVVMLAGELSSKKLAAGDSPVPFCPMLAQGWQYLRVRNVRLLPEIEKARDFLRPALWSTFEPQGMDFILKAQAIDDGSAANSRGRAS